MLVQNPDREGQNQKARAVVSSVTLHLSQNGETEENILCSLVLV